MTAAAVWAGWTFEMEQRTHRFLSELSLVMYCAGLLPLAGPLWTQFRLAPRAHRLARARSAREDIAVTLIRPPELLASHLRGALVMALAPWLAGTAWGLPYFLSERGRQDAEIGLACISLGGAFQVTSLAWVLHRLSRMCSGRATVGRMVSGFVAFLFIEAALVGVAILAVRLGKEPGALLLLAILAPLAAAALWRSWRMACRAVYDFG